MNYLIFVLVGLGVGWVGGRLIGLVPTGSRNDMISGVSGALAAGIARQSAVSGSSSDSLVMWCSALAGALAATLIRRAYADQYRPVAPNAA